MKHAFIDKFSDLDSPLHRLDARLRLIAACAAILIIVTVPAGRIGPFLPMAFLMAVLVYISSLPLHFVLSRCLIILPFVLLAAASYPLSALLTGQAGPGGNMQAEWLKAFSVCCKAMLSVVLLTLLVSTGRFSKLLHGMRQLYMPRLIGILSALMYRYIFIIYDEALRTTRARDSRTPGKMHYRRFKTYGNQFAMIFIRSWERSVTVFQAMASRGFDGNFPGYDTPRILPRDVLFVLSFILLFLAIRVFV